MNERGGRCRGPEPRGSHLIQEHLRARERRAEGAADACLASIVRRLLAWSADARLSPRQRSWILGLQERLSQAAFAPSPTQSVDPSLG